MMSFNNFNEGSPASLEDFLFAMQQYNLVYNSDFRYFSNIDNTATIAGYGIPDGWLYKDSGSGGSIGFSILTGQCVIVKSQDHSPMIFKQNLHEFPRWKTMLLGQCVTAKVCLNLSSDSKVSVTLSDGIDSDTVVKSGSDDFEIEVRLNVNLEAKSVSIAIETTSEPVTIRISKVFANIGRVAISNLPCIVQGVIGERKQYLATEHPPIGEFSLCKSSEELGESYTRLDSVLQKRYGTGPNNRSLLPDMQGYFSRAWDSNASIDPDAKKRLAWGKSAITGAHVSTLQEDEFLEHDHVLGFAPNKTLPITGQTPQLIINKELKSNTKMTGGNETRPKNITELYTIKWA